MKLFVFKARSNRFSGIARVTATDCGQASNLLREYITDMHGFDAAAWICQSFIFKDTQQSRQMEGWVLVSELSSNDRLKSVRLDLNVVDEHKQKFPCFSV